MTDYTVPNVPPLSLAGETQVNGGYARTQHGDVALTFTSDSGESFVVLAYATGGVPQVDRFASASAAERAYLRAVDHWETHGHSVVRYDGD